MKRQMGLGALGCYLGLFINRNKLQSCEQVQRRTGNTGQRWQDELWAEDRWNWLTWDWVTGTRHWTCYLRFSKSDMMNQKSCETVSATVWVPALWQCGVCAWSFCLWGQLSVFHLCRRVFGDALWDSHYILWISLAPLISTSHSSQSMGLNPSGSTAYSGNECSVLHPGSYSCLMHWSFPEM